MKKLMIGVLLCTLITIPALGAGSKAVLSVSGSGAAGSALTFTVKKPAGTINQISFLAISPGLGEVEFPFVTMDLGWPILAAGMGSLNKGRANHKVTVPTNWPGHLVLTWYAQSIVVTPKGGGYIAETTNVIPFVIGK